MRAAKKPSRSPLAKVQASVKALSRKPLFNSSNARFDCVARGDDTTEINIYKEIGGWFGVNAEEFREMLDGITSSNIVVNINSPGGDVFDGIAIYNDLLAHKAYVVVRVTGLAASAASIIALAGDRVEIAENAFFMIHNAWSVAVGDARVMSARANLLKKIDAGLADTYATRTGGDVDDIKQQMDDETWLTAAEAIEQGFADATIDTDESEEADARAAFDLSPFKNVPKALTPRRMAKSKAKEEPEKLPLPKEAEDFSSLVAAINDTSRSLAALISNP